jgi:hypothetical protein
VDLAPRRMVAIETDVTLRLRAALERYERRHLETGDRRAQMAAFWCSCRLVERWKAGLGLGWWERGEWRWCSILRTG